MKKILKAISSCNSSYINLMEKTSISIKNFCEKNGFDYEIRIISDNYTKPASWYKVDFLLDEINKNQHEYILWVDTDAIIHDVNFNIVEDIIMRYTDKEIFLSKDYNNLNCGIILLKCSEYTKNLFETVASMTQYLYHIWWEQAAFLDLYSQNYLDCKNKIQVIDQVLFNSYFYQEYSDAPPNSYGQFDKNKSFIVHFPGMSFQKKLHYAYNYLNY